MPRSSFLPIIFLICVVASGGLGVIGGNTNNYVGLGGCTPEHYLPNLPGYCDSVVMRSPTMWLGIFTGGCVHVCPSLMTADSLVQYLDSLSHDVSRQGRNPYRYIPDFHYLLASWNEFHRLPAYRRRRRRIRFLQESRCFPPHQAHRQCHRLQLLKWESVVCTRYHALRRHPRHYRDAILDG
jgi:hypothetical protein